MTRLLALLAAGLALSALPAAAQDIPSGLRVRSQGGLLVMPKADFDRGGEISLTRWDAGAQVLKATPGGLSFGIGLSIGGSHYDFGGRNDLTSPIDVREVTLSAPIRMRVSETATGYLMPQFGYAGESGADLDDAATASLLAGVSWRLSPGLSIGPGLGIFQSPDDDTDYLPILVIDWQITERLTLSNGPGIGATRGPGLSLSYQAAPAWRIGLGARTEKVQFRMDDGSDVPGGIGTHTSTPVVLSASWQPSPAMRVSGFAGASFDGKMKFKDDSGHVVGESGYDTAPLFGVTASIAF
ncbi:hypothetical protein [Mangrovicoccus sp. HB161399]|uniref:hypothetical protein n=1 Tax=Mangrovicoccus sp. HB161399 TaxID=2720392 RepID=UPI001554F1E1|nr:hypothetical protein [Mangrovicoccus sp. HB161399]